MPQAGTERKSGQVIPFIQDGGYFYKKGIEAYQNKKTERAVSYFQRAIRLEPEEPVFMCQLAIVFFEQGDYEASNDWLYKIKHDVDPSMSECYFFMANNMAHLGEFEEAKENLEAYLDMDEDGEFAEDADALLEMIDRQLKEPERELTAVYGTDKVDFYFLGLLNKGDYINAEKEARQRIAEFPTDWNNYVYLAEALVYQNQWHEAERILKDLLLKEEPNFFAQCEMAVLLQLKRDPQAGMWVRNLINLRPMRDLDCYFLARSLSLTGEYEKAYSWYQRLFKTKALPELPHILHQMAVLAWHCQDIKEARRLWKKIREEDTEKRGLATYLLGELDKGSRPGSDKKQFLYR